MAARPEVASASTQDGDKGRKLRHSHTKDGSSTRSGFCQHPRWRQDRKLDHRHTKDGGRLRCFLTFSRWCQGRPPLAASIRLPERDADADANPALSRIFLRRFPLCGHRLWGQRRLGQAGAFRQPNRRSGGGGSFRAAILRRSKSQLPDRHIGAVPVTSALPRQERQWRGARGAARPGRGHRGGFSGLGAKNIQNCLLTLMDSRNAFHSSCLGMGMAVGSSGRTSGETFEQEVPKRIGASARWNLQESNLKSPLDGHRCDSHGLVTLARSVQSCCQCTGPGCHFHFV